MQTRGGYSGQDYRREDEAALGHAPPKNVRGNERDLPPDAGHAAGSHPLTGEVRGSAGGGQVGEDYDPGCNAGVGNPLTGGESGDRP